jgi:hypothetical protein
MTEITDHGAEGTTMNRQGNLQKHRIEKLPIADKPMNLKEWYSQGHYEEVRYRTLARTVATVVCRRLLTL